MAQLKKNWWKWLCILLLTYAHIVGLLVPLRPGIFDVKSEQCVAGSSCELDIFFYGVDFQESDPGQVFLKFDTSYFALTDEITVVDKHHVKALIDIPEYLPTSDEYLTVSLVFQSDRSGAVVIPRAVLLRQTSINELAGKRLWSLDGDLGFKIKEGFFFPYRNILMETIRSLYFHVPMWFAMIALFGYSAFLSVLLLYRQRWDLDVKIESLNSIALWFGILGLTTGMVWAHNAWGRFWSWDVKQTTTAICLFIYASLWLLRYGIKEEMQRRRITSAYNIFAFLMLVPLLFIIPRLMSSLHPGSGGNPGLSGEDLDNTMRMVFYPAVLGFILLGFWIAQLRWRVLALNTKQYGTAETNQ